MPRLRNARSGRIHSPAPPEDVHEVHPRRHGWHGGGYYTAPPSVFVPREELICGFGSQDRLPTLVLAERSEVSGHKEAIEVNYHIAPGLARIDYSEGSILLNELTREVAYSDAEKGTWSSETLQACEDHADSLEEWTRAHAQPAEPVFQATDTAMVSEYECQGYRATITVQDPSGEQDEITQEMWVTHDVETTQEIYATYRLVLRLFDNHWLDMPGERPGGIVLRTRQARLHTPRVEGEGPAIEDATVTKIGYRLYPAEFFAPFGAPILPSGSYD